MRHIMKYIISFLSILCVLTFLNSSKEGFKWTEYITESIILLALIEFFSSLFKYRFDKNTNE